MAIVRRTDKDGRQIDTGILSLWQAYDMAKMFKAVGVKCQVIELR